MVKSGISYIGIDVPPYVVDAKTIAEYADVPVGKIQKGLMVNSFRFAGNSDTIVTMAANNLKKFVENIVDIEPLQVQYMKNGIGAIYFATETSSELSRNGAMEAMELVEPLMYKKLEEGKEDADFMRHILRNIREADALETKFACTALAKTIKLANAAILAGEINSALVIGSDIAVYDEKKAKNSVPTQGAASTLIYLTRDPLLISLDNKSTHYNLPTYDFYKPGEHTARVPSGYGSEVNYVLVVGSAYEKYEREYGFPSDYYLCPHVPFAKEALYVSSPLFMHKLRVNGKVVEFEKQMQEQEPLKAHKSAIEFLRSVVNEYNQDPEQRVDVVKFFEQHDGVKNLWNFHKKIRAFGGEKGPFAKFSESIGLQYTLTLPSIIGNSYNNSMWVGLASLLVNAKEYKPIVFASYGSGSSSTVFVGEPVATPEEAKKLVDISSLNRSIELSLNEFKLLYRSQIAADVRNREGNVLELDKMLLNGKFNDEGFKLVEFNSLRRGEYQYNGNKVKTMPVIV